jgi:hypothetical protein
MSEAGLDLFALAGTMDDTGNVPMEILAGLAAIVRQRGASPYST